ncbi:MAG TPA: hypothetical protein VMH86_07775 [Rhizomicrobium sp.]|nr:hypothetical protein [Rhizomicrobium sp.]
MFKALAARTPLGQAAWRIAIVSLTISAGLVIADGIVRAKLFNSADRAVLEMLATWCYDLRIVSDTLMSSAFLVFAAAKFLEGRTLLTFGFENIDAAKVSMKGPDADNVVWVGYRYGSALEAHSVATAMENRLKQSQS